MARTIKKIAHEDPNTIIIQINEDGELFTDIFPSIPAFHEFCESQFNERLVDAGKSALTASELSQMKALI